MKKMGLIKANFFLCLVCWTSVLEFVSCLSAVPDGVVVHVAPHRMLQEAEEGDLSTKLINEENLEKANAIGAEVRESIRSFRGGSSEFYERLLKSLLVIICDNKVKAGPNDSENRNPSLRFVPHDDPSAYKDENGNCIQVSQPEDGTARAYAKGQCEVRPTCYWAPINGTDAFRYPTYDLSKSKFGELREGDITLKEATTNVEEWATGLAKLIAPGIVLAVLTFLTMVLFLFCRCCCNKCGGRRPNANGYRWTKKLMPTFIHMIFTAGIIAMLILSQLFNDEIMTSITNVFRLTQDTLGESKTWIIDARAPLIDVRDQVFVTVDQVKEELEGTGFIEVGLNGITSRVERFGQTTANVSMPRGCTVETSVFCYPCSICATIDSKVSESTAQMETVASSGIEQVKESRATINGELVTIKDDIHLMVSDKVNQTEDVLLSLTNAQDTVTEISDTYDSQDEIRQVGFSGVFVLFLLVIGLSIIGIAFGLVTPCKFIVNILHLAYLLGFLTLLFGFLTSSAMLAFSILLGDVCELTLIMQKDWTPYVGESASRGINACFQNQSLLEAYNLTDTLDFQEMIEFPDQEFSMEFGDFDAFRDDITSVDDSTFAMDDTLLMTYIAGMNNFTGLNINAGGIMCAPRDVNYTLGDIMFPWRANFEEAPSGMTRMDYMSNRYSNTGPKASELSNCDNQVTSDMCSQDQDPCGYREVVLEFYNNITTLVQIKTDSKAFIVDMKSNMTGLDDYIQTFTANVTQLQTNLDNIKDELVESLFVHVDAFKEGMYCQFVGDRFNDLLDEMCGGLLPAFLMISLCLLLASVFLIPITICNIILCKRLKAPGDGSEQPEETEFK